MQTMQIILLVKYDASSKWKKSYSIKVRIDKFIAKMQESTKISK